MKEKAVFFPHEEDGGERGLSDPPSPTISSDEWKALRLLTLAGYTIVLFTSVGDRSRVYTTMPNKLSSGSDCAMSG